MGNTELMASGSGSSSNMEAQYNEDGTTKSKPELRINTSLFEIDFKDLKNLKEIGRGASGAVCLKATLHNQLVAVKVYNVATLMDPNDPFQEFENELNLLANCRHPNIVNFFGAGLDPPRICIVLEYCALGSMNSFIVKGEYSKLTQLEQMQMLIDVASGMCYLHSKGIIHRDLKSDNVLLDQNKVCKIADFGTSKMTNKNTSSNTRYVGTGYYMAPEVCAGVAYNSSCDVFSFAIIMWEALHNSTQPYEMAFGVEYNVA